MMDALLRSLRNTIIIGITYVIYNVVIISIRTNTRPRTFSLICADFDVDYVSVAWDPGILQGLMIRNPTNSY